MSVALRFVVPGQPVPKERPRKAARGNFYTPRGTKEYERTVATFALQAIRQQNWPMRFRGPIAMTTRIYWPTARRFDADNIVKAIQDAMNDVAFDDDSQIIEIHVYKTLRSDEPRVEVEMHTIDEGRSA